MHATVARNLVFAWGLLWASPSLAGKESLEVQPVSEALRKEFKLDPFYQQVILLEGFPILASKKVSPYAIKEAAWIVRSMIGKRLDILRVLAKSKCRITVMGIGEVTLDVPEHSDLRPPERWNKYRGLGATKWRPAASCGEENMLCSPGDPYYTENILVHEFAHAIHLMALDQLNLTFDDRLEKAYKQSLKEGKWKGTYAAGHYHEYWAEGVQSWFGTNRENDKIHNHVDTRKELKAYDPRLAAFCEEIFGDNDWTYVRPDDPKRVGKGHLKGLNREKLPAYQRK